MLNKAKGRMFKSVGWTWNPLAGCTHECKYCWAKSLNDRWNKSFEPQIREHFFKDKMPEDGSWIFVGSMGDTFCYGMKGEWIQQLLDFIENYKGNNKFLLQTKNPLRFKDFSRLEAIKDKIIVGTTLETTGKTPWSKAPPTHERAYALHVMKSKGFSTFLSLEPLADFNLEMMQRAILGIQPKAVEIGLENYTNHIKKPDEGKIVALLDFMRKNEIEYVLKENLSYLEDETNE